MASRGARARYYPGANSFSLFSAQGSNPLEDCKVYGKGVQKVYDRSVKGYAYTLCGGPQSKLQLPKHDTKSGLQLLHHFLVFQVFVPPGQHFSVELRVSDSNNTRRKMYFSTNFSDIKSTPLHCQIPISMVIRNKWLSLAFHVADLFNNCFRGGVNFRSIDIIVLGPVCKIRKIFTMRCRITDTTQYGYAEEGNEDCLPQEHLYASGVDSCIQILDMASLQATVLSNGEANVEESRIALGLETGLNARKGTYGKMENSRMVHVAFGTRMPLPLSTVQINTNLPHDKCPVIPKDRFRQHFHIDPAVCEAKEPKPSSNIVSCALSMTSTSLRQETERRKVDGLLLDCKSMLGNGIGKVYNDVTPRVEEKDPSNTPIAERMEIDNVSQEFHLPSILDPLPHYPTMIDQNISEATNGHVGVDPTNKSPCKAQGPKKREVQTSTYTKSQRKDYQGDKQRSKEYKYSRYMDSPPESPPCAWNNFTNGNKFEDKAFNDHFMDGLWMENQFSKSLDTEATRKYIHEEDMLVFDDQDESSFKKLSCENKKDLNKSVTWTMDTFPKEEVKDVRESFDSEIGTQICRGTLDSTLEERDVDTFTLEPFKSVLKSDVLRNISSWQILDENPITTSLTNIEDQNSDLNEEGLLVSKDRPDDDLDLLYDPTLDCYYDPKTNRYYELK